MVVIYISLIYKSQSPYSNHLQSHGDGFFKLGATRTIRWMGWVGQSWDFQIIDFPGDTFDLYSAYLSLPALKMVVHDGFILKMGSKIYWSWGSWILTQPQCTMNLSCFWTWKERSFFIRIAESPVNLRGSLLGDLDHLGSFSRLEPFIYCRYSSWLHFVSNPAAGLSWKSERHWPWLPTTNVIWAGLTQQQKMGSGFGLQQL